MERGDRQGRDSTSIESQIMFKNYIGGEWLEGPKVSGNINPSDTRDVK